MRAKLIVEVKVWSFLLIDVRAFGPFEMMSCGESPVDKGYDQDGAYYGTGVIKTLRCLLHLVVENCRKEGNAGCHKESEN